MKPFLFHKRKYLLILPFVFAVFLNLYIFGSFFKTYFFQDDFFALEISRINSLKEIPGFFIPVSGVQFYRPLAVQFYYFLTDFLFSFQPFFYHLFAYVFFLMNLIFVYYIALKFIRDLYLSFALLFLYALSVVHYGSLNWIANFSYILVNFFYLLGFIIYLQDRKMIKVIIPVIFLLGLLSNELMITFPAVILIYALFIRKELKKNMALIVVLFSCLLIYLIFRFVLFPPVIGDYISYFDKSLFTSLRFALLYFLNFAETMKDQMTGFLSVRESFHRAFPVEVGLMLSNFIIFLLFFTFIPLLRIKDILKSREFSKIMFFSFWTLAGLIPAIFIPNHFSSHQAIISLLGFLMSLILIFKTVYKKDMARFPMIFTALFVIFTAIVSRASVYVNDSTHWIKRRSGISLNTISYLENNRDSLKGKDTFIFFAPDKEIMHALDKGRAVKLFLDNDNISVGFTNDRNYEPASGEEFIILKNFK